MSDPGFPSPYNFVPLSEQVVRPAWGQAVSHDIPFQDGVEGHFDIEIEAMTPLICRGEERNGIGAFFKDAFGREAIPGTSLRGMLRGVVEIASFAEMDRVNDHTHGFRDLNNRHTYGRHMAEIQRDPRTGKNRPVPLVDAGWLRMQAADDEGGARWVIEPCHFAKVEYGLIRQVAQTIGRPRYDPGPRQSAVAKYLAWAGVSRERDMKAADWAFLEQRFQCPVQVLSPAGTRAKNGVTRLGDFGRAGGKAPPQRGRFVFTGQPQSYRPGDKHKKHHDFFFYGSAGGTIEVPPRIAKAFEIVHRDTGQQWRDEIAPNAEWGFWRARLRQGGAVPVFFLRWPDGRLRAFGLAMMFRLAYDLSTREVVRNAQPRTADAVNERGHRPDLAECIFGHVREDRAGLDQGTLRGRVSIGQGLVDAISGKANVVEAVLGVPKPTFYPAYIIQGGRAGDSPRAGAWSTYMNDDRQKPRARGWKRYVARREAVRRPPIPPRASDRVKTRLRPVPAGTRFRARVRVHNLRPVELGAILWALDFGGAEAAVHTLGQARPYGFGMVRIRCLPGRWKVQGVAGGEIDPGEAIAAFRGYMEAEVSGWEHSAQLAELVALATPSKDAAGLRYPDLSQKAFQTIKKLGKALPLHGGAAARRAREAIEPAPPRPEGGRFPPLLPARPSVAAAGELPGPEMSPVDPIRAPRHLAAPAPPTARSSPEEIASEALAAAAQESPSSQAVWIRGEARAPAPPKGVDRAIWRAAISAHLAEGVTFLRDALGGESSELREARRRRDAHQASKPADRKARTKWRRQGDRLEKRVRQLERAEENRQRDRDAVSAALAWLDG